MRNPKLAFSPPEGELDVRRHDPDDGVSVSIQLDGLANQVWSTSKLLLPKTVAEDDDAACLSAFVGQKGATGQRVNSQKPEEVRRHFRAPEFHRLFVHLNFFLRRHLAVIRQ